MPESRRSRRLIAATGAALVFTILAALSFALYQVRLTELDDWSGQLNNMSLLLAEQTSHEMGAADLVLDGMLERIATLGVRDDASLRERLSGEAEFQRLVDRKRAVPQIDVATVVAANGDIVNFTRAYPHPPINLADRDYFHAHRERDGLGLYVSQPVRNKGNGDWTFYLTRRISAPDGSFLGVVLVGVSSRQLSSFFSKINLGDSANVTLYRRDFTTLARWPHRDAQMGVVNRSGSSYQIIEREGRSSGVIVTDSPRQLQGGQRVTRMGAARLIPNYPMLINITVTEDLYMRDWRGFAWQLGGVAAVCCAAVVGIFAVLMQTMRRRDDAVRQQRELKVEADAANRAKSDFLAMMSHEIRTPLTAVIGYAEQLELAGRVDTAKELGRVIARNGHHLLALINDILDMSKVESGKLVLEQVPFAPDEALAAVAALMQGAAAQRGIGFGWRVEGPAPSAVLGDPTRWRQILLNLMSNAIKFTERGEVGVRVWYQADAALLHCEVRDSGIGMSAEQVGRLFAPFEQADSSVARRFGGTGLGLYLVHRLAAAMDGTVRVDSTPGVGTAMTVSVRAPLAPGALLRVGGPVEQQAAPEAAAARLSGRVLLVEDGADNRQLVAALLQRAGLEVLCAADGEQGVAMALAESPALVLMDIQMPLLDGLSATARLRAAGFRTPIVALTANVMAEERERYAAAGFDGWLAKPIEHAAFQRTLARYLAPAPAQEFTDLPEFAAMCETYRASLAERLERLSGALRDGDWQAAEIEAHSIKGSGATFGCPASGAAAARLEAACKARDPAQADAGLQALRAAAAAEGAALTLQESQP
ncbi:ATP-binding protein [Oxalobacteraceae bacterium A2-2]